MFLTPNQLDPAQIYNRNGTYLWPYTDIGQQQLSGSQNLASNVQGTFNLSSFSVNAIPNKLLVFVRRLQADRTYLTTDTYARIDQLQITVNNQSQLLSGASTFDLYNIAAKNGLDMTWNGYNTCGAPLYIKFGEDINTRGDQAPGLLTQTTISVQVKATNISGSSVNYVLYVVPFLEGVFSCILMFI